MLYIICLVLVSKYAPVDNPAKPIVSLSFRKKLKTASIIIVILLGLLAALFNDKSIASLIIGGLVIQSLTLLPFLNKKKDKEVFINE
jgi:accessory gene regulator protein AgrB